MNHLHCDNASKAARSARTLLADIRTAHSAACAEVKDGGEPVLVDVYLKIIEKAAALKNELENLHDAIHRSCE